MSRYYKEEMRHLSGRAFHDEEVDDDTDGLASLNMFHGHAFLPSEVTTYVHEQ